MATTKLTSRPYPWLITRVRAHRSNWGMDHLRSVLFYGLQYGDHDVFEFAENCVCMYAYRMYVPVPWLRQGTAEQTTKHS